MISGILQAAWLFMVMVLVSPGFGQQSSKTKEFVGEGAIIAFQKMNRCPSCKRSNELGTRVEFWIVRIDRWTEEAARNEPYILVQYKLYERGLSDREINGKQLKFALRERRDDEHSDCLGMVPVGDKQPYTMRPAELSDYEPTKQGKLDQLPSLQSLPCLIAEDPPVVIE